MTCAIAVLMDSIDAIHIKKDSTFALMLEAQRRGHDLHYMQQADLALRNEVPWARLTPIKVADDPDAWYDAGLPVWRDLRTLDLILARKDPPVDAQFIYDTLVLEQAQQAGVRVVNDPRALRDANEKLFALQFPQCCAPSLVARDAEELKRFIREHADVVVKPLDGMGGRGIFRTHADDPNLNVILETLLGPDAHFAVAQKYIAEITEGDKRILMINGEAVPYCLARIPQGNDFRGNLATGGRGEGRPLSARDRWIAAQIGPELKRRGLLFVGLDVIGDWLTEINVTSPTCIRELDAQFDLNIAAMLFEAVERS